jgi:hypothetical protein
MRIAADRRIGDHLDPPARTPRARQLETRSMKKLLLALVAALPMAHALAQTSPLQREFPQDAKPIPDSAIKEKLAGKTLALFSADGVKWTYEWKENGFFSMNSSSGVNSAGPWRAENGKICTQPRNMASYCGEARLSGDELYMRRQNGEVAKFEAP